MSIFGKLAPRGDDQSPGSGGGPRGLSRRATFRPEIRAAIALEEAGELQEAARVFEYAGEPGPAAALRLEYAATLRDHGERLDVLREGCARNSGSTPEGVALHTALAAALLDQAETDDDAARKRAFKLEAAQAYDHAGDGANAGTLYEELGLLHRAAASYEAGGEIARLEVVLEVLERQEQRKTARLEAEREVDDAIRGGRRRYAHMLLVEHVRGHDPGSTNALARVGAVPTPAVAPPGLVSRLSRLESRLCRRDRVDLGWGRGRVTAVRGAARFRIGRAPDAELSLPGARLSRYHVELSVDAGGERPRVIATDLGSKVGTFVDGDPLTPGEPVALCGPAEIGLGMAATVSVQPVITGDGGAMGAVIQAPPSDGWYLFLPNGGPLWLAPDIRVPATLLFVHGYVVLDLASRIEAELGSERLPPGAAVELMLSDRITLIGAPLTLEVLG